MTVLFFQHFPLVKSRPAKLKDFLLNSSKISLMFSESFDYDKTKKVARSVWSTKFVIGQTWSPPVPTKFSFVTGRCARLVRCPSSVNSFLLVPLFVAELLLRPPVIGLTAKALSQWHSWSPSQVPCWWQAHPLANGSSCDWEFHVQRKLVQYLIRTTKES